MGHHFHPFISQQSEKQFLIKQDGHAEFCLLQLLSWLSFWSSHYCKTCVNASYRAVSAQEFARKNSKLVYKLWVFHIRETTYSSGHCSMQLRKKKLENLSVGTAEKESCATVAFCAERNKYYSKEEFTVWNSTKQHIIFYFKRFLFVHSIGSIKDASS